MVQSVVLVICLVSCIAQLFYWLYFFNQLRQVPESRASNSFPFVSVIICAKNEYHNLQSNLGDFLNQDYPAYEVIVVDDHSSDGSLELLNRLKTKYEHLRVYSLDNTFGGKKDALAHGIRKSKGDWIGLSDADCWPASDSWIRRMISMHPDSDAVLGLGMYSADGSILGYFIQFDAIYIAFQYLSFSIRELTYMGVGRNLFYRKELYVRVGGFRDHRHILSGDDDLFISQASAMGKFSIQTDPLAFTYSSPKDNFRAFFRQKSRHLKTAPYYSVKTGVFLFLLSLSHMLFYCTFLMLLGSIFWLWALILYVILLSVMLSIVDSINSRWRIEHLTPLFPVMHLLWVPVYLICAFSYFFPDSKW